jgi:hypothetical protein
MPQPALKLKDSKPGAAGSSVLLGTRTEIFPSSPLPDFANPNVPAFMARLKDDAASDLVAYVCTGALPGRFDIVNGMRNIDHPAVLRLVDSGVVSWPDGVRYGTLVYRRPLAPRFMRSLDETRAPLNEDTINRYFVTPMIGALTEFLRTGIVHGAIRTTNIFWQAGSTASPQLGECLTLPPGIGQPALFETIERGMTMPSGRGPGHHTDDCYAFGVMIALLVLGHNPFKGLDDHAVVQAKMERGSFNAIIGHHRLSPTHSELLRGLLTDDPRQRWTAADLDQWLGGRRLTHKSSDADRRASRHIEFAGHEYWQVRSLANALANHVPEAARLIGNGTLDKWLRRSLGDEDKADDLADAVASIKEGGKIGNYEDQLVARACIALDPRAPIRYRGLSIMPAGVAGLLVEAIVTGGNVQNLLDIIDSQLVIFWVDMQKEMKTELVPLAQQFERLAGMVEKTSYGNGVERATYELNPAIPCLSPMLRALYVTSVRGLLPALERVATSSARARDPMDRHIAAFLVVRDRKSELLFDAMSSPDNAPRRALAMLTLYADMQNRHGPESLPGLAQWLLPLIEPSLKRYFGKSLREGLQKQIRDTAERGNLGALQQIVDNPQRLQRDEQEFIAARLLYLSILKEINALEGKMANRDSVVDSVGAPLAASISGFIALAAVMFAIGRAVWTSF